MSGEDLSELLAKHGDDVRNLGESLLSKDTPRFVAAAIGLLTSLATGVPLLGLLADKACAQAFAHSANARLARELAALETEEQRRELVSQLADPIEAMIGQAIIQLVRTQHRVKDELVEQLGGIRQDMAAFREDFGRLLGHYRVQIDIQRVTMGATGIRVGPTARKWAWVSVLEQHVSGKGSVGIDLG